MANQVKFRIADCLPPVLDRALRDLRGKHNRYLAAGLSWEEAAAQCTGYDSGNILSKVLEATLRVKRGEAAFERDSVLFDELEWNWPVATGLLLAAVSGGNCLSVLDFGGSLGSVYFQNRAILNRLVDFRWNVVEQAHYVYAAKTNGIQEPPLYFYDSLGACLAESSVDLVLLLGVLQYLREPDLVLDEILHSGARWVIIDRTPFIDAPDHRLLIQKVPKVIYPASYPMWALSEAKIRARLGQCFREFAVFDNREGTVIAGGCQFDFKGMIWEVKG